VEDAQSWANGKRGATDVPDTDPAYHNNAKYYAGLAQTSANAAAGSQTGAQAAAEAAQGAVNDAEAAASLAEEKVQEAIDAIVSAQGNDIVRMDSGGHMFIYEEDEEEEEE
jgi:hypothetical protein